MKKQSVGAEPPTAAGSSGIDQRPQHPFLQRRRAKRPRKKPGGVEQKVKERRSLRMSASAVATGASWCCVTASSAPRPTTCHAWAWASGPSGNGNVLGIIVTCVASLLLHFATFVPIRFARNTKMGQPSALPRMGGHTAVSMTWGQSQLEVPRLRNPFQNP